MHTRADDAALEQAFEARRQTLKADYLLYPIESLSLIAHSEKVDKEKIWRLYGGSLFISHQSEDRSFIRKEFASRLHAGWLEEAQKEELRRHNLEIPRLWWDLFFYSKASAGSHYYEATVGHALLACGSALIVVSKNSAASYWVPRECDVILARQIPFTVVVLDDTRSGAVHPGLSRFCKNLEDHLGHTFDLKVQPQSIVDALVRMEQLLREKGRHR